MSKITDLNIYVDIQTKRLVRDIFSNVEVGTPIFTQGDSYNLKIHAVEPVQGRPVGRVYQYVPLPDTLFAGVGKIGNIELGGEISFEYDSETSALIDVNSTAAQVQTAINAISGMPTVTVSGPVGGPWQVTFADVGARDFIAGDSDAVFPFAAIKSYRLREGGATTKEIQLLVVDPQLATLAETFTALPDASGSVTKLQAGTVDKPDIQRVAISPEAYDGGFILSFNGTSSPIIPHNTDAEDLQQILESVATIGADNVRVTGQFSTWDVSFINDLQGNQNLMVIDVDGVVMPIGRQGILTLATGGIEQLLSNQASAEAKFEISGIVDGNHATILQVDCVVRNDGIQNDPVAAPTTPTLATQTEVTALDGRVDNVEDRLDAVEDGVVRFDEPQSLTPEEQEQARDNINVPVNPMTTEGDIIVGGTSGVQERLAVGASGTLLRSNGTTPFYSADRTNVQVFTASGTWVDPDATLDRPVDILIIGGGGGGGSGASYAPGSERHGGGGGAGGALVNIRTTTGKIRQAGSVFGATVTVGAGGSGGASRTGEFQNGQTGTAGSNSSFAGITAVGGAGGIGGGIAGTGSNGGASTANSCLIGATLQGTCAGGEGYKVSSGPTAGTGSMGDRPVGGGGGGGYNDADSFTAGESHGISGNSTIGNNANAAYIGNFGFDAKYGFGGNGGDGGTFDTEPSGAGENGAGGLVIITTLL
jgi:hypothetical protein